MRYQKVAWYNILITFISLYLGNLSFVCNKSGFHGGECHAYRSFLKKNLFVKIRVLCMIVARDVTDSLVSQHAHTYRYSVKTLFCQFKWQTLNQNTPVINWQCVFIFSCRRLPQTKWRTITNIRSVILEKQRVCLPESRLPSNAIIAMVRMGKDRGYNALRVAIW